jgi:hypothetical protein
LSSLTAIFGNSEEKTENSDKLMELYWNRAELKKEFAGLRKEKYRMQEVIKEHEGRTARVQQQLDHLENLLVDPEWAHNVVVFYQLRGLGKQTEVKLGRFAEQLKQKREQKTHDSLLVDWNEKRKQEARDIEAQALDNRDQMQMLEDQLQSEQNRLTSMNRFTRLFRGRSTMKLIDSLAEQLEIAVQQEQALHESLEEIMNARPPDHQGLDIPAKRSINLMILAYAQQVFVHFDKDGLAPLVKESTEKSVGAINYGTPYECNDLLKRIQASMERLDSVIDHADVLKQRAKMLAERAIFPSGEDAVPTAASVATLIRIDDSGLVRESELDMVRENYWGMAKIFSR